MTSRHCIPLLLFLSLCFPLIALSADTDIVISEVQITGTHAEDEFIELYSPKSDAFSLNGLKLCRKTSTGSLSQIKSFSSKDTIPAKGFFLFANSDGIFTAIPSDADTKSSALGANNSIAIVDSCSTEHPPMRIIDSVAWGSGKTFDTTTFIQTENIPASKSLVRNLATLSWSLSNATTPTNSHGQTLAPSPPTIPEPTPPTGNTSLRINELLPNPTGDDTSKEWVELSSFGTDLIDLKGWKLITLSGSSVDLKETLSTNGFLIVPLSLRNTSETVSLIDPSKNIVNEVSYEHAPSGNSLNFFKQGIYRWSNKITEGEINEFNNAPETKEKDIPDTTYRDVLTTFSASGKDGDGDTVKYTWDFGDGHKSYKRETTHRYAKEGKYEGTLTVTDGTESVVTYFTIDVEKYEAPKVRMIALVPNPTGKDNDAEYITLENRSKKSVDLLGWSIATGWKKLVNHPIRESFVIPKKSSRNITHASFAFTLPNEKGRIELRSPDGETVQKLKYNLKGKSAEENARLVKEKGKKWEWIPGQGTGSKEQGAIQTTVALPADGLSAVAGVSASQDQEKEREIEKQEEQLKQDTKTITQRKNHGETLLSTETNAPKEMRRLISFGIDIETPAVILALAPQVAGASDEISPTGQDNTDTVSTININALINHWLARE